MVSTHAPLHAAKPAGQTIWHTPPSQLSLPRHRVSQVPQCFFALVRSKQPPVQAAREGEH